METEGAPDQGAGPAAPAAAAAAPPEPPPPGALEFGWVPAEVVHALVEEVGNFRARAEAIELLHAAVLEAGREPAALLPTLSAFLAFLLRLVGDANFKIAISAMTILEDLVGALGADAAPYLGTLALPLIERLGDNMVRQAAGRAVSVLARALGPAPVLAALGGALVHPSWRAREEGANTYSAALLAHPKERLDYPACVRALAAAAGDEHPRVAAAALEALALLHARLGALLAGLMTAVGAPEEVKRAVAERAAATPQLGLPALDAQGNLLHQAHARPPSAQQRARPAPAMPLPASAAAPALSVAQQPLQQRSPTLAVAPGLPPPAASDSSQPATQSGGQWAWAAGDAAASLPPGALPVYVPPAAYAAAAPYAAAGGYGYSDVAASVELSSASCASSSGSRGSYFAAGVEQEVERSEGSLLNWQRPMRRPNQQSFTGPAGGRAAAGSASASSAAAAQAGRADVAEQQAQHPLQQASRAGSLRSLVRPGKPVDGDLGRRGSAPAAAMPAPQPTVVRRSLPPQAQLGMPPSAPLPAAAPSSAGLNSDLSSSVRNWQRQRHGSGVSDQSGDADSVASTGSWGGVPADQEAGLAVEARSDSLLQWRLPQRPNARPSASSPAAGAAEGPAAAPALEAAAPAAASPPQRIGSASFRRALTSFKNKLGFGGEADGEAAAADEGVPQKPAPGQLQLVPGGGPTEAEQQPGSPVWSIAAVRQAQDAAAGQLRGGLSVVVPDPAGAPPGGSEQPQAESPGKGGGDRLSRLKQMTERRRVWSAPTNALRAQLQQLDLDGDTASATLPLPSSPGPEAPAAGELAAAAEAASCEVSPGVRPGLQALKARARTARILSSGSLAAAGLGAPPSTAGGALGSGSLYSMEAMEAVFGPDQPVGGAAAPAGGLWSPIKTAGGSTGDGSSGLSSISPPRLSVPLRSAASGGLQWPDSPSGAAGTPTGRSTSAWRNGSFSDSPTAAGSPKAGAGALGDTGSTAFQPASDTAPLAQPEAALAGALAALQVAALSQKKELDWQAQFEGLRSVRRLALHHAGLLLAPPTLHALVALVAPVVDALRSTLSRLAIAVLQSLAEALGPALDAELDAFVPLLLKRAGQISISGRDNFLAVEADRALSAVVERCGDVRPAAALLNCLSSKSPDVRAKAAMHLDACLQLHGPRLVGGQGGTGSAGGSLHPRLLRAAVALLEEGGLEARTAGKRMLWELRRLMDGDGFRGEEFKRALARLDCKSDKVWDVFEAGRMPAAPARLPSTGLRPPSGGPPSPTAASFSPAKPGSLSATGTTLGQASRAGSVSLIASALGNSGSAGGSLPVARPVPGLVSAAAVAGALPPSKWAPGARSGSNGAAHSGSGVVPPSTAGSSRQASRPGSAGMPAGPVPSSSLSGLDPDLQQRLEGACHQLGSTEWKARLEGLEAVAAAVGGAAAAALPQGAQLWLADALALRVVDANLRVQQQALAVLNGVLDSAGPGLAPAAPALAPAICKCLDSGNPSVRQAAVEALDAALRSWSVDVHLPHLMAAAGSLSGGARSKAVLLDRLAVLAPPLWASRPALIRQHVLPALFSLLAAGKRPELRQLAQGALCTLAGSMGGELARAAAASPLLGPPQQQLVAECVAAAGAAPS